jgi:ribose transport system substrate-binding protein
MREKSRGHGHGGSLVAVIVLTAALVVLVAGCGSSSTQPASTQAGSGGTNAKLTAARALVEKLSAPPTSIGRLTALRDPAKLKGKTFVYMSCAAPICVHYQPDFVAATKALGAKAQVIYTGPTPTSIQQAWSQLAAERPAPAAVVAPANPPELFQSALRQVLANGTKVVLFNTPLPTPKGVSGVVYRPSDSAAIGRTQASLVYELANGNPGHVLFVAAPQFTALTAGTAAFKATMQSDCASCQVSVLNVQASDIGQSIPTKVVSFLQANPDVKYVVTQFGDLETGVPQAIREPAFRCPSSSPARPNPPTWR